MRFLVVFVAVLAVVQCIPLPSEDAPLGCPKAPSSAEDRRSDKKKLVLATYNVNFLFLKAGQGQLECPGKDCDWKNDTIAESHLSHIAEIVGKINADIISFNELEDCYVLERLAALLPNLKYKPYLIPGKDTFTGQNSGILTRIDPIQDLQRTETTAKFPVVGSTCPKKESENNDGKDTYGNSKHYMARFKIDGVKSPVTIVATHLLSQPDSTQRCPEREAQVQVLADAFLKPAKEAGDEIIVWGDMNDFDISVKDSNNNVPISSALKILRDAGGLTNAASLIPQSERYSDWYDRDNDCKDRGGDEHSLIDHVLLSNGLFSKVRDAHILHAYEQTCGCIYSDHWPTVVTLEL